MYEQIESFIYISLGMSLILFLLSKLNLSKDLRYKQIWSPLALFSFIIGINTAYLFNYKPYDFIKTILEEIPWQNYDLPNYLQILLQKIELTINIVILISFFSLKLTMSSVLLLKETKISSKFKKKQQPKPPKRINGIFYYNDGDKTLLKQQWFFSSNLLNILFYWGIALFFVLMIIVYFGNLGTIDDAHWPYLAIFPCLLILETKWFLAGRREKELPIQSQLKMASQTNHESFRPLWLEYQEKWGDYLLSSIDASETPKDMDQDSEEEESQEIIADSSQYISNVAILESLGQKLKQEHKRILRLMLEREDLIIINPDQEQFPYILNLNLVEHFRTGKKILWLVNNQDVQQPLQTWIRYYQKKIAPHVGNQNDELFEIQTLKNFRRKSRDAHILLATPFEILRLNVISDDKHWFESLGAIVILEDFGTVFQSPLYTRGALQQIKDHLENKNHVPTIIISPNRVALEPALRQNAIVKPEEIRFKIPKPRESLGLIWDLEHDEAYQHVIYEGDVGCSLGVEPVLAMLAWRNNEKQIHILDNNEQCFFEYLEEIQKYQDYLNPNIIEHTNLQGSATERINIQMGSFLETQNRAMICFRDLNHNVSTLSRWLTLAKNTVLVHMVSPDYMLRLYLIDNLMYFAKYPLIPFAPTYMDHSHQTAVFLLWTRMVLKPQDEASILSILNTVEESHEPIVDRLQKLFWVTYKIDLLGNGYLKSELIERIDEDGTQFLQDAAYRLDQRLLNDPGLNWFEMYMISDTSTHRDLGFVTREHLYQNYLPRQKHVFSTQISGETETQVSKLFEISEIDHNAKKVKVKQVITSLEQSYRSDLEIFIKNVINLPDDSKNTREIREGWTLDFAAHEADFIVETHGYTTISTGIGISGRGTIYTPLEQIPMREYIYGKLWACHLTPPEHSPSLSKIEPLAFTLSAILNESFCTLFPENHQFIKAFVPYLNDEVKNFKLLPKGSTNKPLPKNKVTIYVIEDSMTDLGLVRCLMEHWEMIFALLQDFLNWAEDHEEKQITLGTAPEEIEQPLGYMNFIKEAFPELFKPKELSEMFNEFLIKKNDLTTRRKAVTGQVSQ